MNERTSVAPPAFDDENVRAETRRMGFTRRRVLALLAAGSLVAASCSGDGDGGAAEGAEPPTNGATEGEAAASGAGNGVELVETEDGLVAEVDSGFGGRSGGENAAGSDSEVAPPTNSESISADNLVWPTDPVEAIAASDGLTDQERANLIEANEKHGYPVTAGDIQSPNTVEGRVMELFKGWSAYRNTKDLGPLHDTLAGSPLLDSMVNQTGLTDSREALEQVFESGQEGSFLDRASGAVYRPIGVPTNQLVIEEASNGGVRVQGRFTEAVIRTNVDGSLGRHNFDSAEFYGDDEPYQVPTAFQDITDGTPVSFGYGGSEETKFTIEFGPAGELHTFNVTLEAGGEITTVDS